MTLQALYGTIPQIFGKGECARVRNAGVSGGEERGPRCPDGKGKLFTNWQSMLFTVNLPTCYSLFVTPKLMFRVSQKAQRGKKFDFSNVHVPS